MEFDQDFHEKSSKLILELRTRSYNELLEWYVEMLYSFMSVQQVLADAKVKVNSRWKDSETLVNKLILHLISLKGLYQGTEIELRGSSINGQCRDISSIYVLLRAVLENLMIYNHVFISSRDEKEVSFKHDVWMMTSLIGRQKIKPVSSEAKEIHEGDKIQIENISTRIKENIYFKKLTKNQQKEILNKGDTRLFKSWTKLLDDMGFGNVFGIKDMYFIMSNYAHSEALSIMQINDSKFDTKYDKDRMLCYSVVFGMVFLSRVFVIQLKKFKILEIKFNMVSKDLRDRVLTLEKVSYYNIESF